MFFTDSSLKAVVSLTQVCLRRAIPQNSIAIVLSLPYGNRLPTAVLVTLLRSLAQERAAAIILLSLLTRNVLTLGVPWLTVHLLTISQEVFC